MRASLSIATMAAAELALRSTPPATGTTPSSRSTQATVDRFVENLKNSLWPKQRMVLESPANEILFGGSAGPGKSHGIRCIAIYYACRIPGLQVYLFRRTHPVLVQNHMRGRRGFPILLKEMIDARLCKINWSDLTITFWNTSYIQLSHCQYEKDVYNYQGAEIDLLMPDELTLFAPFQYTFLRSRLRTANLEVPPDLEGMFPRIIAGSNPGGIGHQFVKMGFIDQAPPYEIWRAPDDEGGMMRQYIPALLSDNPSIENPEEYIRRVHGLGNPALVKAMAEGDWNIMAGGFLEDLWDASVHVLEPFDIPRGWRIDRSFDWGSSKPFSVGWWAESDGSEATMADGTRRSWPRGTVFRIYEWYGWNGKPNEGLRLGDKEKARGIIQREKQWNIFGRVNPGPADSSIFDVPDDELSIAQKFEKEGIIWLPADKSPGSRVTGGQEIRARLAAALEQVFTEDGRFYYQPRTQPMEEAGLFFFSRCRQAIRTLPTIPADDTGDDVDTNAEDHVVDEVRYRLTANKNKMISRMSGRVPGY